MNYISKEELQKLENQSHDLISVYVNDCGFINCKLCPQESMATPFNQSRGLVAVKQLKRNQLLIGK